MYLGKLGDLVILGIDFSMENLILGVSNCFLLTWLAFPRLPHPLSNIPTHLWSLLAPMASESLAADIICRILFDF